MNRFQWKSTFSIRETLRKISLMLDEWVESLSNGVHWIHWKRLDSDRKVHFLFVRDRKISLMLHEREAFA